GELNKGATLRRIRVGIIEVGEVGFELEVTEGGEPVRLDLVALCQAGVLCECRARKRCEADGAERAGRQCEHLAARAPAFSGVDHLMTSPSSRPSRHPTTRWLGSQARCNTGASPAGRSGPSVPCGCNRRSRWERRNSSTAARDRAPWWPRRALRGR